MLIMHGNQCWDLSRPSSKLWIYSIIKVFCLIKAEQLVKITYTLKVIQFFM
ncbi:Uncharacterised protein [Escherichia coli]|nr:Uncharacterised protein [Escherichia coli]